MNRQYIEDNHIVDRYLFGQLSEAELCEFEAYYFEHPEMLEELTIAKAMHNTVREESGRLRPTQVIVTKVNWFERVFQPKLGFALSAVMAVGVASLWLENSRLRSAETVVFTASSLILSQTRGANAEIDVVKIVENQSALSIRLVTGPIGYSDVELQLKDSSGNLIWQGTAKVDGPVGGINLVLVTRHLISGEYTLSAFPPTDKPEALSIHKFKVELL